MSRQIAGRATHTAAVVLYLHEELGELTEVQHAKPLFRLGISELKDPGRGFACVSFAQVERGPLCAAAQNRLALRIKNAVGIEAHGTVEVRVVVAFFGNVPAGRDEILDFAATRASAHRPFWPVQEAVFHPFLRDRGEPNHFRLSTTPAGVNLSGFWGADARNIFQHGAPRSGAELDVTA